MSQIPAFLKSLAALVRSLASEQRAVHVTAKTADELELLAGLAWEKAWKQGCPCLRCSSCACPGSQDCGTRFEVGDCSCPEIAPSDIAHGWLRGSKAQVVSTSCLTYENMEAVQRAAECAELAAYAAGYLRTDHTYWQEGHTIAFPTLGTIEGARAAWGFVVERWAGLFDGSWAAHVGMDGGPTQKMLDTYRRELEAMK